MRNLLLFSVDQRRYALPLDAVRRVVRMVEVTPVTDSPPGVAGVVNWGGRIVPVIDLRTASGGAPRPYLPSDHLLFAEAQGRTVALAVDAAEGVFPLPEGGAVPLAAIVPGATTPDAVATVAGEIAVLWDLGRFLAGAGIEGEAADAPHP